MVNHDIKKPILVAGIRRMQLIPTCCGMWQSADPTMPGPQTSRTFQMKRGFVYLFAVIDWASRRVLSWRLSNTMTTDFCLESVQEAIHRYGTPDIFNIDQGSQFTSVEFTKLLIDNRIAISMDGKGCWRDNVFVERLWKSVNYEEVYLHAYDTVSAARSGIGRYLDFYNARRPHSSLGGVTPDTFYNENLPVLEQAA